MIIVNKLCVLSNKLSKRATAGDAIARDELVHVLVDTELRNDKLKVRAYTTRAVDDPLQRREHTQYLAEKKRRESGKTKKAHAQGTGKSAKARRRRRKAEAKKAAAEKVEVVEKAEAEVAEEEVELAVVEEPFAIFYRFVEVRLDLRASESEKIGLDMIIESPPEGTALDSAAMLMNDTNHLEIVLQALLTNLEEVETYVVRASEAESNGGADAEVGWEIAEALSAVPKLSPQKFEKMISNRLQDFLMMVYLGKMTKAQLVIADKINQILPSTVPGFEMGNKD